jgi:hypothetical protein
MEDYTLVKKSASQPWIQAICLAKFDHELGMIVEKSVPPTALVEQDIKSVAMLSFPESNCSDGDWEHTFFYRFRHNPDNIPLNVEKAGDSKYLFGYAHYMQRKDPSLPRGYYQKSFVIITPFYFTGFYSRLVQLFGKAYFANEGEGLLQVLTEMFIF